jgi:hypothetical protein
MHGRPLELFYRADEKQYVSLRLKKLLCPSGFFHGDELNLIGKLRSDRLIKQYFKIKSARGTADRYVDGESNR